jgi:DNA primase
VEPGAASPIGTVPATEDEGYYEALATEYESAPAGNVNNNVANSQSPHPSPLTPQLSSLNPLYSQERLIVQQLIRHGEKTVFVDEESGRDISVTEYIAAELEMDEITLSTPLFAEVLKELQQHIGEPGFTAERHFINHANPALSRLAVDLIEEKYQLSKYHSKTQTIVSDAERLEELMLHLVVDYKHSLVEIELKETLNLLRQPEVMSDADKCLEVMSRCKELMEIKQQMAKHLGDRVIDG